MYCLKHKTADTLSHTCRNLFIKSCYRLFPPFRYVKHNNIIAKGGIWSGTLPQTADTLSHTCRNLFIKSCYCLFRPFRYVKQNSIIAKGGIWCGASPLATLDGGLLTYLYVYFTQLLFCNLCGSTEQKILSV